MTPAQPQSVRRRRVFYIPGYDPFHPRRYRELYRRQGALQAEISGFRLALSPGRGGRSWTVISTQDNTETRTEFEVLAWSDIVRASMGGTIPATYAQMVHTAWIYLSTGALFRLMQLRKGPILVALYPVVVLLLQAAAALGLGWLGMRAAAAALPGAPSAAWLAPGLGAAAAVALLQLFRHNDRWFFAYYLMHDYAFSSRWRGAYPPELDRRIAEFGSRIEAALTEDWDEVLVVGHSSGAHLAVSLLARLIRDGRANGPAALGLLTLGQAMPMISFLPEARALRADLALMAGQNRAFWLDVSAPGDACAFALCDPAAVSGVAPPHARGPLILSAAFSKTIAPGRWRKLRRHVFRLHFQYLCAFEHPGSYDYSRITAGPLRLADRFAGQAPSRSRITRVASRHTAR